MNTLVEFEAKTLVELFHKGDILSIHMFMDSMSMPFDVQDKLFYRYWHAYAVRQRTACTSFIGYF